MLTLGQRLKLEREKRGLSIKDLELATSIRSLYLEAIERDDFSAVPGEVYLKGFIRNYAIAVELAPAEVLEQYRTQTGTAAAVAAPEPPPEPLPAPARTKPLGTGPVMAVRRRINWRRAIMLGLAFGAALAGLAYWLLSDSSAAKTTAPSPAKSTASVPAAAQGTAMNVRKAQLIQIQATATDDCWAEVTADGKQLYSGMLKANQKANWEAKEMLRIKLGNAGAVQISLNGRPLPALGKPGEVVERIFSLADA